MYHQIFKGVIYDMNIISAKQNYSRDFVPYPIIVDNNIKYSKEIIKLN